MYGRFALALSVTRRRAEPPAGADPPPSMPWDMARRAIDRAVASVEPAGELEVRFTGGEPLLEASLIRAVADYARLRAGRRGIRLSMELTTGGTVTDPAAWSVMAMPEMDVGIAHDGLPELHNLHHRLQNGCGSSARVLRTIRRLLAEGRDPRVVMAVRPDTMDCLSAGILFLHGLGVHRFEPRLDLGAPMSRSDRRRLQDVVVECARIWRDAAPGLSISWFDDGLLRLAGAADEAARVAVTPSGDLHPCEHAATEEDRPGAAEPIGHVSDGADFLDLPTQAAPPCEACRPAGNPAFGVSVGRSPGPPWPPFTAAADLLLSRL